MVQFCVSNILRHFTMLKYPMEKSLPSHSRIGTSPRSYCLHKYNHGYRNYGYILQNNLWPFIFDLLLSRSCLQIRAFWDFIYLSITSLLFVSRHTLGRVLTGLQMGRHFFFHSENNIFSLWKECSYEKEKNHLYSHHSMIISVSIWMYFLPVSFFKWIIHFLT